jgi:predicted DNA binding protein
VQYATMVDLIEQARLAGVRETEGVKDALADAFEHWMNRQDLREITDEEEETLRMAFEKGFANYYTA